MQTVTEQVIKAIEFQNQGRIDDACTLFAAVLDIDPKNGAALYSLALMSLNRGELDKALDFAQRGCTGAPHFAPMRFVCGAVLQAAGRRDEALRRYDEALDLQPEFTEVLINSGALLREMHRHKEALERFVRVLSIDPEHTAALANSAILLTEFKQSQQAIAMFERLLAIKPDYDYGLGLLLYERLHCGDWTDFTALREAIHSGVREGKRVCKSLAYMALSDVASEHFLCARIFAHHFCPPPTKPLWKGEAYNHHRIRVAYVSPDLREHPVGHLMAGVFEHHDKARFEIYGISLGIDDGSRLRGRMVKAFDRFIDAREMGSRQIAELMRAMEVDIAVDLAGYTSDSRVDIFSHRPAPAHVNFLGYPGTLGVGYMDYVIADRQVIPPEHQPFFSEKVIYLPECYLPTDAGIQISNRTPSRMECGLPESGVVFCSFSHDYKISPPLWQVWMRLLQRIPGSVLWLTARNELTQSHFRKAATDFGIDGNRIIFASRVPFVEDHLARYRLADLFLDTWPYNAHTTAADALMAGLPVITHMGNSFPARVAGSLLHAAGLPDLVTRSFEDYEALAYQLVTSPTLLAELKERLRQHKDTSPLFDTSAFCRNLETAYADICRTTAKLT